MKISEVITKLQDELAEHGDVEVKLDIEGVNCNPDFYWHERTQFLYLW